MLRTALRALPRDGSGVVVVCLFRIFCGIAVCIAKRRSPYVVCKSADVAAARCPWFAVRCLGAFSLSYLVPQSTATPPKQCAVASNFFSPPTICAQEKASTDGTEYFTAAQPLFNKLLRVSARCSWHLTTFLVPPGLYSQSLPPQPRSLALPCMSCREVHSPKTKTPTVFPRPRKSAVPRFSSSSHPRIGHLGAARNPSPSY